MARLRDFDVAERVATWLAERENAEFLTDRLVAVLPHVAAALDDRELREFTAQALGIRLRDIDIAPLLGKALGVLTAGGYHGAVLDRASEGARDFLDRNAEQLAEASADGRRRRWWMPSAVNKQMARAILKGLRDLFEDLQVPDSAMRRRVLARIDEVARDLFTSPLYRARFGIRET